MPAPVLVRHDLGCKYARPESGGHTDAAKRVADWWNLHWTQGGQLAAGQWIAVALADGTSDGVLYASRRAAIVHQHHNEQFYAYLKIMPTTMTVCMAESVMRWHRLAYDRGHRLPDPDDRRGGPQIIPRLRAEDHQRQLAALSAGEGCIALGFMS